jgi:hypothetical protein
MTSNTCRSTKRNNERCKRSVAEGHDFCWQHSRGLLSRMRSLTGSQSVGLLATVVLGVASLALAIWFGLRPGAIRTEVHNGQHVDASGDCSVANSGNGNSINTDCDKPKAPNKSVK